MTVMSAMRRHAAYTRPLALIKSGGVFVFGSSNK